MNKKRLRTCSIYHRQFERLALIQFLTLISHVLEVILMCSFYHKKKPCLLFQIIKGIDIIN